MPHNQVIDAELLAILRRLELTQGGERVLVASDCESALGMIQAARGMPVQRLMRENRGEVLHNILVEEARVGLVVYYWLRSHIGSVPIAYSDCAAKSHLRAEPLSKDLKHRMRAVTWLEGAPDVRGQRDAVEGRTFKTAHAELQKEVVRRTRSTSQATVLDDGYINRGHPLLSKYVTGIVTRTAGRGSSDDQELGLDEDMVLHARAGGLGLPHDRAWSVCGQGEYYEWMRRLPCPVCNEHQPATLSHVLGCRAREGVAGYVEARGMGLTDGDYDEGVWCDETVVTVKCNACAAASINT